MNSSRDARARRKASAMLRNAKILVTQREKEAMEVTDFGLDDPEAIGLQLVVYENNDRYCAKELILFPHQTCPEHRHPPLSQSNPGKQETFRCRWGRVYLYVDGPPTKHPKAELPEKYRRHMTVWHEIVLNPGDQFTLAPNTRHWFQAGNRGAVVSEFSSMSDDASDEFTDPAIRRLVSSP
jgi:D-lyxose ketol-isomerase